MSNLTPLIRGSAPVELLRVDDSNPDLLEYGDGAGVSLLQVEFDIFDDHPNISGRVSRVFGPHDNDFCYRFDCLPYAIHGTAVSSLIVDPQFGVAPDVNLLFTGIEKLESNNANHYSAYDSILPTLKRLNESWNETVLPEGRRLARGDIVSISLQSHYEYPEPENADEKLPIDSDTEILEELVKLDERGLIIFIAAGNSKIDLDQHEVAVNDNGHDVLVKYADLAAMSPAIKVGYTGLGWANRHWSNYGSMVKFFAPTGSMRAACYDYNEKEHRTDLIDTFSGGFGKTSAATPIIASIAARLQSAHKKRWGVPMDRNALLSLMEDHYYLPGDGYGNVGKFPLVGRGIEAIRQAG